MARQDNFHSRLVAWMKIILPIAALGLLSTLFLISKGFDPSKTIPLAEIDLEQRAQDQGATNATFAGMTSGGDEVMITAEAARPSRDDPRLIRADTVAARVRLLSGTVIDITSRQADLHQSRYTVTLFGDVVMRMSTGYVVRTDRLIARIDDLHAESPGRVSAEGPRGTLTAGRMVLTGNNDINQVHLLFTGGVKLLYQPKVSED